MGEKNGSGNSKLSEELSSLLDSIEAAGKAVLPQSNDLLLKSIVEAAARIFNAAGASIMLVNEAEHVLVFRVSCGPANKDLVGMKFPMDKGVAGAVVLTGEPLVISNVRQDPRFHHDFAESTGYVPSSILAMPLKSGERVIGVMEVLDKLNASSFGMQDIELLGMFASQAAIAIDQSQNSDQLQKAMLLGLRRIAAGEDDGESTELLSSLDSILEDKNPNSLLALADLFGDISRLGQAEQKACLQILKTFAEYQRSTRRNRYER